LIRYIVEKVIQNEYGQGTMTLMEEDRPKTFVSKEAACKWLIKNDEEFNRIPIIHLIDYYNIKPYVI
jgi:hypothetical protein